jgi:CHAD domain-containing protein
LLPLAIGVPTTLDLHDRYLDTPDWRIYRAGYALRIRSAEDRVEACLKELRGPVEGIALRRELREPLPAADPDLLVDAPGAVGTRVSRVCGRRSLRVIGELRTRREERCLREPDGREGAIALDETTVLAGDGAPAEVIRRIEVEVPADAAASFQPFVGRLQAEMSLPPAGTSKFECALLVRCLDPEASDDLGSTEVDADLTAAEVALAVLRRQFAAFLRNEPGVLLGENPDYLHDMRVASRRLRAALRLFENALPARPAASMRAQLRAVGRALGAARDLDVMIAQVGAWTPRIATTSAAALDPLLVVLEQRREAARRDLLRILDSPRYERLVASATEALRRVPSTRPPGSTTPIRLAGPAMIGRARKKLVKAGRGIHAESAPAAYHDLRIRAKRLRYAIEFLAPIYGGPAKRMIRALVRLQDLLGLRQDSEVAIVELRGIVAAHGGQFPAATMLAIGELAQMYADRIGRMRKRFRRTYRRVRGRPWKRLEEAMTARAGELASDLVRDAGRNPGSRGDWRKKPCSSTSSATQSPSTATPSDGPTTAIDL